MPCVDHSVVSIDLNTTTIYLPYKIVYLNQKQRWTKNRSAWYSKFYPLKLWFYIIILNILEASRVSWCTSGLLNSSGELTSKELLTFPSNDCIHGSAKVKSYLVRRTVIKSFLAKWLEELEKEGCGSRLLTFFSKCILTPDLPLYAWVFSLSTRASLITSIAPLLSSLPDIKTLL